MTRIILIVLCLSLSAPHAAFCQSIADDLWRIEQAEQEERAKARQQQEDAFIAKLKQAVKEAILESNIQYVVIGTEVYSTYADDYLIPDDIQTFDIPQDKEEP